MSGNKIDDQRREFLLKGAGTIIGTGALLNSADASSDAAYEQSIDQENRRQTNPENQIQIPDHRLISLPGLHSYAERSIVAGEKIRFRTSSTVPFKLSICQLAGEVDDDESDVVLQTLQEDKPKQQPIHPGSYVHVERSLEPKKQITAITIECWIRPWRLNEWQGVITQHDYPKACGIGLFLDSEGRASFYLGDGTKYSQHRNFVGAKLNHRRWNHVAGTWDGKQVVVWVNGRRTGTFDFDGKVIAGESALRIGAYGTEGKADRFLDGDIAMPTIYSKALNGEEVIERIGSRGLEQPPAKYQTVACWPLTEERGIEIKDASPNRRHGRIVNHATWMIGGPSFNSDKVGRYDENYHPEKDSKRGHGLRFASDDLYDCRWKVTQEFQIPASSISGLYVGKFDYQIDGKPYQYFVTFNVRRPSSQKKPPILVLLSSSTWTAYNSAPFPTPTIGAKTVGTNGFPTSHPAAPAYSCYRDHRFGQPAYFFGRNIPWPAASPNWLYLDPKMKYSHLMRGELFLHRWLDGIYKDHDGYNYDVVTDYDLHCNPSLLKDYKVLFINGHSEYWSKEAYEGVDNFLGGGGTVVALSGNTMFWRTTFSDDGSVMECRKFDPRIGGRGGATIGELFHCHDQKRGSLMRECGMPAWKCIGLECCGWCGDTTGSYQTELPEHFLFTSPEDSKLVKSETFGHARDEAYPMSIGHEWDVRVSTLAKMTRKIPDNAQLPDEPDGIQTLARGIRKGGGLFLDYFTNNSASIDSVCAELIYWERPQGGKVFHAGAIAAGSVLAVDPKWQTVMRNVLHHFGVPANK